MNSVLWTLAVEVIFYIIIFSIGQVNLNRLIFLQAILLSIILAGVLQGENPGIWRASSLSRYLLMILIGSAFYVAEKEENWFNKAMIILSSCMLSYVGFQLFKFGKVDPSSYETIGNHLLAVTIFLLFWGYGSKLIARMPGFIIVLADMVYPLYLVHAAIGLVAMALVREYIHQPYIMLLSAVLASLLASWVLHKFVEQPAINFGRRFTRLKSSA